MFGVKKEQLVKRLVKISCSLCGYIGSLCDCKYMGDNEDMYAGSEQTGCPETAMAATLINSMTSDEFRRIAKRARIHISEHDEGPIQIAVEMKKMKDQKIPHLKTTVPVVKQTRVGKK